MEQRLNLTVETRHQNKYRQITIDEERALTSKFNNKRLCITVNYLINIKVERLLSDFDASFNIVEICMFLDGKDTSNAGLEKSIKKKVRSCMSKKLKNDKYRQKENFSKEQMIKKRKNAVSRNGSETLNKKKRGTEDNQNDYPAQSEMKRKKIKKTSKNQNNQCMPSTSHKEGANGEASEVENFQSSDEDITIPLKKSKFQQINCISSATSDSNNDKNDNIADGEGNRNKIQLHRLVIKLNPSIYRHVSENENAKTYTWEELKTITKFTEREMNKIFTPDCCVFLKGKRNPIFDKHEFII